METVAGFESPEEAALELELPLLGTLPPPDIKEGAAIAPAFPADERARREYHRAADRLLLSPHSRGGSIGLLGDVSPSHRALVASRLAASVAAERTAILVDGDVRAAHLSFDDRDRAQEGLVDVLRYGVRSPRVVAPTQTPGLNLLPVGSGTVDLEGTFGSDAVRALFEELGRTGDLLLINGPDLIDFRAAASFLAEVDSWILVHEIGVSDSAKTRRLRDTFGRDKCVGILAVTAPELPALEVPAEVTDTAGATGAATAAAVSTDALEIVHGADPGASLEPPAEVAPPFEAEPQPAAPGAEELELATTTDFIMPDAAPPAIEEATPAVGAPAEDAGAEVGQEAEVAAADLAAMEEAAMADIAAVEAAAEVEAAEAAEAAAEAAVAEAAAQVAAAEAAAAEAAVAEAAAAEAAVAAEAESLASSVGADAPGLLQETVAPTPAVAVPEAHTPVSTAAPAVAGSAEPAAHDLESGVETSGDRGSRRPLWIVAVVLVVAVVAFFAWRILGGIPGGSGSDRQLAVSGEGPQTTPGPAGTQPGAADPAAESGGPAVAGAGLDGTSPDGASADAASADAASADAAPPGGAETTSPPPPAWVDSPAEAPPPAEEVQPPVESTPPVERSAPVGTTGPRYGVHVASVKAEAGARREAARYEGAGYPTVLRQKEIPGKGLWWRVYVGPYGTKGDASRTAGEIKKAGITDYTQVHRLPEE